MLTYFSKNLWLALSFMGLNTAVFSQNAPISTTHFLITAKTKPNILRKQVQIDALKSTNYHLPLLEKISFQTETDRFQLQRQQYQTRATINSWAEMKKEKQWQQASVLAEEEEKKVLFQDIIADRYAVLVEYYWALKALDMYKRVYQVFADKRTVLQKMAKLSTDFNIEDLIKAEENAYQYQQKITTLEGTIDNMAQLSQSFFDIKDSFRLDTLNWIPLSKMRFLTPELPKTGQKNAFLSYQLAQIELLQANYNVEKANSQRIFDYVQVKYGARQAKEIQNELSIGVVFLLPYKGSSKTTLNKIAFKQVEEKISCKTFKKPSICRYKTPIGNCRLF
jgi:hypothetical protein